MEQNNVNGEKRFFLPVIKSVAWNDNARSVDIPFEYRPLTNSEKREYGRSNQQDKIIDAAANAIPRRIGSSAPDAVSALDDEHRRNAKGESVSRLEHHLRRYTRRNDSDFFIHKDLKGFLNRELDFYLKNEVLNLDEISAAGETAAEGWFQQMRLMKKIGGEIIDFLTQIEEFQKMLWEKKKFVVDTQYCVTLGNISEDFHAEIVQNDAQWKEWRALIGIDESDRCAAFLQSQPTLMLDTRYFSAAFTDRLLASFNELDSMTEGLLIHSENWQALRLLQEKYKGEVKCVYIDPPYNTDNDTFLYKDSYKHSSWMTMMKDRFIVLRELASSLAGVFVSTDDGEYAKLQILMSHIWNYDNFVADVIWNSRKSVSSDTLISIATNHTTFFAKNKVALDANKMNFRLPHPGDNFSNPDNDPRGSWTLDPMDAPNVRENLTYPIVNPLNNMEFLPPVGRCWRFEQQETERLLLQGRIVFGRRGTARPQYKRYLTEARASGKTPTTLWDDVRTTTDATNLLLALFGETLPRTETNKIKPKPNELVERCAFLLTDLTGIVLDYFAGSGTTAHAVINLNREDSGQRKFILVEMGDYFDTVLLPRIKKVTFTPEWEDGKPKRHATPEEAERSPRIVKYMRLESYEDALDCIEFNADMEQMRLDERIEDYLIKYMLKWETRGSATLLNADKLTRPFSYKLRSHANGTTRERTADVAETFNYLLGLNVRTRRVYDDDERRYLVYRGKTREAPGKEVAVIWRDTDGWTEDDHERDRAFIAERNLTDGADTTYINGTSCVPGATELAPLFHARMFAPVSG